MARAGAAAALVLSFGLRALAQDPVQGFADSVEREFAIRRWAQGLGLEDASAAGARALDVRVSLLRAHERAAEFATFDAPWARAGTWEPIDASSAPDLLCAALRLGLVQRPEDRSAAARHPLPTVRLAALQSEPAAPVEVELLAVLARDADERVADAALDRVVTLALDGEAAREFGRRMLEPRDARIWLGLARRFERTPPSGGWIEALGQAAADEAQRAIVAALRLRWSDASASAPSELARIATAWPGPERHEELFTAAARVSRAPGSALGAALLETLGASTDELRCLALLRGSLEALPAGEVVAWMRERPETAARLGGSLFEALALHAGELGPEHLAPWLEPRTPLDDRRAVVALLRTLLVDERRAEFGTLLVRALEDAHREVVDDAFVALCDARPVEPWIEPLYRRWRTVDARRAESLLAELPRGVRLEPFQSELCAIASLGGASGAAALELLAPLAPDAGIAAIARERLDEELSALERLGLRATELRAAALVRALHEQAGPSAHAELERVMQRTRERAEVSKVAAWALGQDPAGRERLAKWIAPDVPRRLRIEAALARASWGDPRAVTALRDDWPACDFDLRTRALRAVDASGTEAGLALLRRVALESSEDDLHRELALDLLAARKPAEVDTLAAVALDRNLDLRRHALLALGTCGDARAIAWLRSRLAAHDGELSTPELRTIRELEREAIWMSLAAAQALDARLVAAWLAAPLDAAHAQLRARFQGRAQGGTEFSWRAELAVGEELARSGALPEALDRAGPWWNCDARLLAALGERALARGDLTSARRLLTAAAVGLCGEAEGEEREQRLFEVRCSLLAVWDALGAFAEHGALVRRLVREERLGRGPHRAFERVFGSFDPARGIDGLARLEASAPTLRARVLASRGELDAAREAAAEAAALAGHSSAARATLAELEPLLRR